MKGNTNTTDLRVAEIEDELNNPKTLLGSWELTTTETQHTLNDDASNYSQILVTVGTTAGYIRGSIVLSELQNFLVPYWYNSAWHPVTVKKMSNTVIKVTDDSYNAQYITIYGIK